VPDDRWQRVKELFGAALELPAAAREAYLREACGGDEALRRDVELLFKGQSAAGEFLSKSPGLAEPDRPPALAPGRTLGTYEIVAAIGAGGMGEVYCARDAHLGREVAIKVLPNAFGKDADRVSRFAREARLLASLNHPNIAAIHGFEESNGTRFLIMELVPGETLSERLSGGALPVKEALSLAQQIAEALEEAHAKGIVHRDLKPANVKVTGAGKVKVLDFGLAKALAPESEPVDASQSPTLTRTGTAILGTAAYMSPEQARGKPVDKRTDVWAFGCVLFEMLTGKPAFEGETTSDLIVAILKHEPDWTRLPAETPARVRALLRRCLQKDAHQRVHDIADARIEVEEAQAAGTSPELAVAADTRRARAREYAGWIAALLALALAGALLSRRQPGDTRLLRASINLPDGIAVDSISLSPDGRSLAFAGAGADGRTFLWLRPLDRDAARALPGTEGAADPFWSPDGRFVGFFAQGSLKKVDVTGGLVEALSSVSLSRGGTWNRDGVIVFCRNVSGGLYRISATGGQAAPVTNPDASRGERSHRWPSFLPDGRHILYAAQNDPEKTALYVTSLDGKEQQYLTPTTSAAVYAPPGYIIFERAGALVAQAFDPGSRRLSGDPTALADEVAFDSGPSRALFAVSESGVLAYQTAASYNTLLAWFDRSGKRLGELASSESTFNPALSPDGTRVALSRSTDRGARNIWIYDLLRGTSSRLTFDPGVHTAPIWSPDGTRIVFGSTRQGAVNLYQKSATGSGAEEPLLVNDQHKYASDWSADGRFVAYDTVNPKSDSDLWILPMTGERKPIPFLRTPADETHARFSPDGRWLAYMSNESGKWEVYVQPFPASGGRWQVSRRGGVLPQWRRDGKELFYIGLDQQLTALSVKEGATFEHEPGRELFEVHGKLFTYRNPYAVSADGQRFYFSTRSNDTIASPIRIILNWTAALGR
jgi:Tol biopolymer transport system component